MFPSHFIKSNALHSAKTNLTQLFYRRCTDDIFVLFELAEHFSKFRNYFNTCHQNISFSFEQEKNEKFSYLDIEVFREKGKLVTTASRKPTFGGVYTHFKSFLTTVYKFGRYGLYCCLLLFQNLVWLGKILWRTQFFETIIF